MKQFIKNNKPYAQTEREDFAQKYLSEGCEEVPVLYSGVFLNPIWNGSEWIEGATPEEIAEANKPIVPQTISAMRLTIRVLSLYRGVKVSVKRGWRKFTTWQKS